MWDHVVGLQGGSMTITVMLGIGECQTGDDAGGENVFAEQWQVRCDYGVATAGAMALPWLAGNFSTWDDAGDYVEYCRGVFEALGCDVVERLMV